MKLVHLLTGPNQKVERGKLCQTAVSDDIKGPMQFLFPLFEAPWACIMMRVCAHTKQQGPASLGALFLTPPVSRNTLRNQACSEGHETHAYDGGTAHMHSNKRTDCE